MTIQSVNNQSLREFHSAQNNNANSDLFAKQLTKQAIYSQKADSTLTSHSQNSDSIALGQLGKTVDNVAKLLLTHPQLKSNTWTIVHNEINKNKPYDQIPVGTTIFFNKKTQELHWQQNTLSSARPPQHSQNHTGIGKDFSVNNIITDQTNKIKLGQLNHEYPTVSNLLSKHDDFKAARWNIIHSGINKNKAFTKIPDGSTIFIDAKTHEISWSLTDVKNNAAQQLVNNTPTDKARILSKKLDEAVKPYLGTPYKDIDCYTLVVHGLKNMGVRYKGEDSLSRELLNMAQAEGRAQNAYFTGEGITQAMGKKVYTKAISTVEDIAQQSRTIFQEMKSLMQKGDLLSFSLQSKGHTGVISQNQNQWTYINSGRLDNSLTKNAPKHGVGEESLLNEINNWIKLAQQRKESLQITVGRLNSQKFV